jgi:nucleoside phosphorylase
VAPVTATSTATGWAAAKIEATTKEKEVELKMFVEETRVMTQDLTILDSNTRAWYEKKQREIMAHDM